MVVTGKDYLRLNNEKYRTRRITVAFDLFGRDPGVSDGELKANLARIFDDWRDGRYPFTTEMVREGIIQLVDSAIRNAVTDFYSRKYQGRMVTSSCGNVSAAAGGLIASLAVKDVRSHLSGVEVIGVETTGEDDARPFGPWVDFPELEDFGKESRDEEQATG